MAAAICRFMLDSDANTAKTLTLVAIILQVVFFVIGILAIGAFAALMTTGVTTTTGTTVYTSGVGIGIFGLVFGVIFLIGLLWILLDYFLVYKKLAEERVEDAETPALILGIIQLLFGGVITGILLIVAYVKIKDSTRNRSRGVPPVQQGQMN